MAVVVVAGTVVALVMGVKEKNDGRETRETTAYDAYCIDHFTVSVPTLPTRKVTTVKSFFSPVAGRPIAINFGRPASKLKMQK